MEEQTPENSTALTEDCGGNPCSTTLKTFMNILMVLSPLRKYKKFRGTLMLARIAPKRRILRSFCVRRSNLRATSRHLNP